MSENIELQELRARALATNNGDLIINMKTMTDQTRNAPSGNAPPEESSPNVEASVRPSST